MTRKQSRALITATSALPFGALVTVLSTCAVRIAPERAIPPAALMSQNAYEVMPSEAPLTAGLSAQINIREAPSWPLRTGLLS